MQPTYSQQGYRQSYRQYPGPSTPRNSRPRVHGSTTTGFSQPERVAPSYNAQYYTTDIYRDQPIQPAVPAGPGYGNDTYGGRSISGYDFYYPVLDPMAGSWGIPASQPLHIGDYSMPSIPNSNFGQGESSYAGYHFDTGDQVPGPTMNFSPQNPGVNTNQVASPVWRFHNCWVSHSEQDEVHLTIALKRT